MLMKKNVDTLPTVAYFLLKQQTNPPPPYLKIVRILWTIVDFLIFSADPPTPFSDYLHNFGTFRIRRAPLSPMIINTEIQYSSKFGYKLHLIIRTNHCSVATIIQIFFLVKISFLCKLPVFLKKTRPLLDSEAATMYKLIDQSSNMRTGQSFEHRELVRLTDPSS